MIVFRKIKQGKPFQSSVFREELIAAAKEIKKEMIADYKKTYVNWKHKPTFSSKILTGASAGGVQIQVATDDAVYGYVDYGTKPHIIRAKTSRGLRFLGRITKGTPKTQPNVVGTFPGTPGEGWTNKMFVKHLGSKPRNFTKHIAKTAQRELARVTKNALARAARRSGHSVK